MPRRKLVKKGLLTSKIKYIQQNLFKLATQYNYYYDFGGYLNLRSCMAYVILKRMLSNALDKYPDEVKESDDWEDIKNKEKERLMNKYFFVGKSSRIEDIIEWLKPKYQLYRDYPILHVKTYVICKREPRKHKKDLVRRFMFVPKECYDAMTEVYNEFKSQRERIMTRAREGYYKQQRVYNIPEFPEKVNRDVWLQPTTIKAMEKIMEYPTEDTHFVKYKYNRGKQERIKASEVKQIMEDINGESY